MSPPPNAALAVRCTAEVIAAISASEYPVVSPKNPLTVFVTASADKTAFMIASGVTS